jgi:phospholipase C
VVRAVANGLLASSAWHSSAFLLSYDTAGGWYDHVAPPFAADGTPMGLRVPTVLLSPYVSPGSVVHDTYDAAAVLGFIEHNWRLRPLSSRDRDAASLLPAFSFGPPPRHPVLVDVKPTGSPVARPDSTVLYAGYLTLLAAAVGCIVGAATWRGTVSGRA